MADRSAGCATVFQMQHRVKYILTVIGILPSHAWATGKGKPGAVYRLTVELNF